MLDPSRYFDHAATSPMREEVRHAMEPWLGSHFGNAHSIHAWGQAARAAVERCRSQIASLLGADDPAQIIFTSGATEANALVIHQFASTDLAASPFEHRSILEPARVSGFPILGNSGYELLGTEVNAIAVTAVCNETGGVPTIPAGFSGVVHRDVTQAVGHIPVQVSKYDFASFSAHKIGGPTGIGLLYGRQPAHIRPLMPGGGQEMGIRSGTLNVAGIVGMAKAMELAVREMEANAEKLGHCRAALLDAISSCDRITPHLPETFSPHILSLQVDGVHGETVAVAMDLLGFAISSGSACSANSDRVSAALLALGMSESQARSTIRVSFGLSNTPDSARKLGFELKKYADSTR